MAWKMPQTEEEWMEYLSAYLDGELPFEERKALEEYLQNNPEQMRRLQGYQQMSSLLRAWTVRVPDPNPSFVKRMAQETEYREKPSTIWQWLGVPTFQWGQFASGMIVGIFSLLILQAYLPIKTAQILSTSMPPANATPVYNFHLSQEQAENLLQEVTAKGMVVELKTLILNRNWSQAAQAYQLLQENYANTKAFIEVKNQPDIQALIEKINDSRSI